MPALDSFDIGFLDRDRVVGGSVGIPTKLNANSGLNPNGIPG